MPPKRPHSNPLGDESSGDSPNGHAASPPSPQNKKQRTNNGPSPSPSTAAPTSAASAASKPSISSIQAQLAAAKAKINAQLAGRQTNKESTPGAGIPSSSASSSSPSLPPSAPKVGSTALPPTSSAPNRNFDIAAIKKKIEEGKRKAAAGQQAQKNQGSNQNVSASSSSSTATTTSTSRPTGIHPLLMQTGAVPTTSGSSSSRTTPSSSTFRKGAQPAAAVPETVNPYLAAAQEEEQDGGQPGARPPGSRSMHRTLKFNRQGRHIQAAEEARREAELEALKRRIQESAKRAGMQEELTGEERKIKRQPPPDVEWWDAALLPSGNYDCVPDDYPSNQASTSGTKPKSAESATSEPLIMGQGTPIDIYIQHPIPIPAPTDKFKVEPKGVMLTKKEMKKMRKQRRLAEQQDKQDRIKMGLQPPDPPKVKLSNLMRVLASEQVADPTKVEARVRRQVAARKEQHEKDNAERALTPDQRRGKIAQKMDKDEAKGTFVCVYKIKHLVSGAHKFKVRKNAQQNGLTGLCIFHPDFALVLVEGPSKGIKAYKRLMTVRIDWTDPGRPKDATGDADDDAAAAAASAGGGGGDPYDLNRSSGISARFLAPMGEVQQPTQFEKDSTNAALVDWSTNTCQLIFEGPQRERYFPQGFRARNADTDYDAREILGTKWSGFWDVAKKFESAREED